MAILRSCSGIVASSYYVPAKSLTHAELSERFGAETMGRVADSAGIMDRRVSEEGECSSDLAFRAAEDLFKQTEVDRTSIDFLIFATQTPDYLLPTTACILQNRLKLRKSCGAFDINLGCSQYVYSISMAHSLIASGLAKRVLVLTGDTVSKILHPLDRSVVPLFGDAGTATLIDTVPDGQGFQEFIFGSDGSGSKYLIWPTSGLREHRTIESGLETTDKFGCVRRHDDMYMDGKVIYVFTLKVVPETVQSLLQKAGKTIDEIDLFVFHQASELIIESSAKKLGIPKHKLHYKLHDVGNSGGSTVGIALTDAWLNGRVKPGMNVVLVAFGVGLSWAATLIKWPEQTLGPACTVDYSNSPAKPINQVTDLGI